MLCFPSFLNELSSDNSPREGRLEGMLSSRNVNKKGAKTPFNHFRNPFSNNSTMLKEIEVKEIARDLNIERIS